MTPDPPADRRPPHWGGALAASLPALDDVEGSVVPPDLPPVMDAHVHVFPDALMEAVRRWFDAHGWPVRYRLSSDESVRFLLGRGVKRLTLLHYAHRPGMARDLNRYVAGLCATDPRLTGLATVFPGEPGAEELLEEAFDLGLAGVKLHQHVQCFDPDGPEVRAVCEACVAADKALVAHLGREPKSPAYRCDPHALCSADKVGRLLADYPGLRLCVPHLGADEFTAYAALCRRHGNLWLDTTMMLSGYLPGLHPPPLTDFPQDRVLYGTDFCNLPYAWDRELKRIREMRLSDSRLERLLARNAEEFFDLLPLAPGGVSTARGFR
ncbi:MAG: amidohydrolase [Proteobacteria bacterium]|nr:amidohydrolase [Pseudomonadota bacterium]